MFTCKTQLSTVCFDKQEFIFNAHGTGLQSLFPYLSRMIFGRWNLFLRKSGHLAQRLIYEVHVKRCLFLPWILEHWPIIMSQSAYFLNGWIYFELGYIFYSPLPLLYKQIKTYCAFGICCYGRIYLVKLLASLLILLLRNGIIVGSKKKEIGGYPSKI